MEPRFNLYAGPVALINAYNRLNVIAGTPAGSYRPGRFA